jgi:hypothetical protein
MWFGSQSAHWFPIVFLSTLPAGCLCVFGHWPSCAEGFGFPSPSGGAGTWLWCLALMLWEVQTCKCSIYSVASLNLGPDRVLLLPASGAWDLSFQGFQFPHSFRFVRAPEFEAVSKPPSSQYLPFKLSFYLFGSSLFWLFRICQSALSFQTNTLFHWFFALFF